MWLNNLKVDLLFRSCVVINVVVRHRAFSLVHGSKTVPLTPGFLSLKSLITASRGFVCCLIRSVSGWLLLASPRCIYRQRRWSDWGSPPSPPLPDSGCHQVLTTHPYNPHFPPRVLFKSQAASAGAAAMATGCACLPAASSAPMSDFPSRTLSDRRRASIE